MSKKNRQERKQTEQESVGEMLVDNTPLIESVSVLNEPQAVDVTAIPLNAEGYTCVQIPGAWVLEKAVLKVGLEGVANKEDFFKRVKAEMSAAGITVYQSSRYKGMEITDKKVKQRIAYVTQNIGGKNPEHRWTLLSVNVEGGIKFEAAPMPVKMIETIEE